MLRSLMDLKGFNIMATDGLLGKAVDCLTDERKWAIKYMVVETGSWFWKRKLLIASSNFDEPKTIEKVIPAALTMKEIRLSPFYEEHPPISLRYKFRLNDRFTWAPYYDEDRPLYEETVPIDHNSVLSDGVNHLRSLVEMTGYEVEANKKSCGVVKSFIIDTKNWMLRYAVVDTGTWYSGKLVLIPTSFIDGVNCTTRSIDLGTRRDIIETAPTYDSNILPATSVGQGRL